MASGCALLIAWSPLRLLYILAVWGTDKPASDINGDDIVNVDDILFVIANEGLCE